MKFHLKSLKNLSLNLKEMSLLGTPPNEEFDRKKKKFSLNLISFVRQNFISRNEIKKRQSNTKRFKTNPHKNLIKKKWLKWKRLCYQHFKKEIILCQVTKINSSELHSKQAFLEWQRKRKIMKMIQNRFVLCEVNFHLRKSQNLIILSRSRWNLCTTKEKVGELSSSKTI